MKNITKIKGLIIAGLFSLALTGCAADKQETNDTGSQVQRQQTEQPAIAGPETEEETIEQEDKYASDATKYAELERKLLEIKYATE